MQRPTKVCAKPVLLNIVKNEMERWVKTTTFFGIIRLFKTGKTRTNWEELQNIIFGNKKASEKKCK